MTIAHLSDLHFGRIADGEIVRVITQEINEAGVDLVAVSGDLTQRAREGEYEAAAEMLRRFDAPTLVVPGNHDVYAWWHPVARIFYPYERYKRYITEDLTPSFEREDVAVLGVNSAYGRTVKGGKVSRDDLELMERFFAARNESTFKVLMLHHHLTKIQALGPHDVARRAKEALEIASRAGVDLILCGHLHISHIEPLEIKPDQHRLVIVSAGTATSTRGRRSNRRTNFYNLIDVQARHFDIQERRFVPEEGQFATDSTTRFERLGVAEEA